MTDTIAHVSPSTMPSRADIAKMLGGSPFSRQSRFAIKVYAVLGGAAGILIFCGPAGVYVAVGVLCLVMIFNVLMLSRITTSLITGKRFFRPAVEAVASGRIGYSYVVRGFLCQGGLAIVDEQQQQVWLNGEMLQFGDFKRIDMEYERGKNTLILTTIRGANPVTRLQFDTRNELDQAYARLGNTLGMS